MAILPNSSPGLPNSSPGFLQAVRDFNCITYTMPLTDCTRDNINKRIFSKHDAVLFIPMVGADIRGGLVADIRGGLVDHGLLDFRDLFFQSNPFNGLGQVMVN